ncbi:hypothetical protein D3C86_2078580 [compost metagenome]
MVDDLVAIDIGRDFGALAYAQGGKLAFLEIGIDPEVVQADHGHHRRTGGNALAELHAALGDMAFDGRQQTRALQREV